MSGNKNELYEAIMQDCAEPDEELINKTLKAMTRRRTAKEQKTAARNKVFKKLVATAAIIAVLMGFTPLGGYVAHAASDAYEAITRWVQDVFDINMTKKDNGCQIKIVNGRAANDFLYLQVKSNMDETYMTRFDGTISDNQGNSMDIISGYYTGDTRHYTLYVPNMTEMIDSADKQYTCHLNVSVYRYDETILNAMVFNDTVSTSDNSRTDDLEQITVLSFDFTVKNVNSVVNATVYDINYSFTYDNLRFECLQLVTSDIGANMIVEVVPLTDESVKYKSIGLEIHLKNDDNTYSDGAFCNLVTITTPNDGVYLILNYVDFDLLGSFFNYLENSNVYTIRFMEALTKKLDAAPPYTFEVTFIDLEKYETVSGDIVYTETEDISLSVDENGMIRPQTVTVPLDDFTMEINTAPTGESKESLDFLCEDESPYTVMDASLTPQTNSQWGLIATDDGLTYHDIHHYGGRYLDNTDGEVILIAEHKGQERFRLKVPVHNPWNYDEDNEHRITQYYNFPICFRQTDEEETANHPTVLPEDIVSWSADEISLQNNKGEILYGYQELFQLLQIDSLKIASVKMYENIYSDVTVTSDTGLMAQNEQKIITHFGEQNENAIICDNLSVKTHMAFNPNCYDREKFKRINDAASQHIEKLEYLDLENPYYEEQEGFYAEPQKPYWDSDQYTFIVK